MKIVIPVDNKNLESNISSNLSRAPYFLFYDTLTKDNMFLDNKAASSQGGAGILAAQQIIDLKADALISMRCGKNAYEALSESVKIYKPNGFSIMDNINLCNENKLSVLTDIHEGFHHHGGK